ncbi:MAG TPA: tRNA (adenosine(37)-N6)-threonylcarbamoyltransferase complex ATPase subunit type 1 TsaE [Gemmatimonadota bacterium]|nr:tRNA (adenosine(37)-N6)-threonylcarbamoyltransferase complex ATPase subunit type 1 TsaE [Gemmatimonadota bacterium]
MIRWRARAAGAAATRAIGRALGAAAPDGAVLLLEGPLGVGKTTLAQGVAEGCGVREPVTSPTYNLVLHYDGARPFTHVDLYRLADAAALETLDPAEILDGPGVTCVEWPDLIRDRVAAPWGRIRIEPDGDDARRLAGELAGPGWEPARAVLAGTGAEVEP